MIVPVLWEHICLPRYTINMYTIVTQFEMLGNLSWNRKHAYRRFFLSSRCTDVVEMLFELGRGQLRAKEGVGSTPAVLMGG